MRSYSGEFIRIEPLGSCPWIDSDRADSDVGAAVAGLATAAIVAHDAMDMIAIPVDIIGLNFQSLPQFVQYCELPQSGRLAVLMD